MPDLLDEPIQNQMLKTMYWKTKVWSPPTALGLNFSLTSTGKYVNFDSKMQIFFSRETSVKIIWNVSYSVLLKIYFIAIF